MKVYGGKTYFFAFFLSFYSLLVGGMEYIILGLSVDLCVISTLYRQMKDVSLIVLFLFAPARVLSCSVLMLCES